VQSKIILVIGLLWANYDIFFAGISLLTVVFYVAFTLAITTWRMKYQYGGSNEKTSLRHASA
jgi:ATP-binding cassette subfamily B protein